MVNLRVETIEFVVLREPDPEWSISELAHRDLCVLAFAFSGKVNYEVGSRRFTASKGDLIWFPPGKIHSASSDPNDPWRFCSLGFRLRDESGEGMELTNAFDNLLRVQNSFRISALLEELYHEWTGKRIAYMLRCRSIVEEVLFAVIRAVDHEEQRLAVPHVYRMHKVARLIEQNPEKAYTVGELAANTRLSAPYFRRLFKQVTGYTPVQYQHWVKINKAKDLLLSGECNVSEAAFQLGFDNVFYFSRLFKRIAHVNPSDYLRR